MERFDSGYTLEELDAIVDDLLDDTTRAALGPEAGMIVALELGLSDGDLIEESERGTVMLPESREEIDRRLAAVREKVAAGASLMEAVTAAVG